jgi:hypothetical protein
MKTCETYAETLPEFLEGALAPDSAADVAMHLADCAGCRGELQFVRTLTAVARKLPQPQPGDAVVLKMMEAALGSATRGRRSEYGPVMDVEELADYLRVDRETLEPYLDDIPCFELGGKLLFRRQTIEEWIQQKEQSLGFVFKAVDRDRTAVPEGIQTGGAQWTL